MISRSPEKRTLRPHQKLGNHSAITNACPQNNRSHCLEGIVHLGVTLSDLEKPYVYFETD